MKTAQGADSRRGSPPWTGAVHGADLPLPGQLVPLGLRQAAWLQPLSLTLVHAHHTGWPPTLLAELLNVTLLSSASYTLSLTPTEFVAHP